jgi:hypothetical protein
MTQNIRPTAELINRLSEFSPTAFTDFAKACDVLPSQFQTMIENGSIVLPDLQDIAAKLFAGSKFKINI